MQRVLFVAPSFHTNLVHALGGLVEAGLDVALVTAAPGAPEGAPDLAHRVAPAGAGFGWAAATLRAHDPDLVAIRKTPRLSTAFGWAARLQGRPTVAYDLRPWRARRHRAPSPGGWLKARPARRFTPVRGLSGAPDPRAFWLPFPVRADAAALAARAPAPNGPRVLCVGKLAEARKRQPMLIEALAALERRSTTTLTLVGSTRLDIGDPDPGHLARLRRHAVDGPLAGRLALVEDAPYRAMPALYAAHDLLVLPAASEPFGMAVPEALAQGCAVLVADDAGAAGYVAEAAESGVDVGALFATGDGASLTAALDRLLDADALAARGAAAARWMAATHTPERFARDFLAMAAALGA